MLKSFVVVLCVDYEVTCMGDVYHVEVIIVPRSFYMSIWLKILFV